jgi:hypothetical protein
MHSILRHQYSADSFSKDIGSRRDPWKIAQAKVDYLPLENNSLKYICKESDKVSNFIRARIAATADVNATLHPRRHFDVPRLIEPEAIAQQYCSATQSLTANIPTSECLRQTEDYISSMIAQKIADASSLANEITNRRGLCDVLGLIENEIND